MNPAALILARGGSKGLPGKHLRLINGTPVIGHVVQYAVCEVGTVFVTTDDAAIADTATQFGAEIIDRPPHLATDESPSCEAVWHAVNEIPNSFDALALLEGATLIMRPRLIRDCFVRLLTTGADSALSVVRVTSHHPDWTIENQGDGRVRYTDCQPGLAHNRQRLTPRWHISGACTCIWHKAILKAASEYAPGWIWDASLDVAAFEIDEHDAFDLHTPRDLQFARLVKGGV